MVLNVFGRVAQLSRRGEITGERTAQAQAPAVVHRQGQARRGERAAAATVVHQVVSTETPVRHLEVPESAQKHHGLPVVLHQRIHHQEEGVADRQGVQTVRAVIIDHYLSPVAALQQVLAFFGGCQVCQGGFALLQTLAVEAVATVDIDGAANVVDVEGNKWPAVNQQKVLLVVVLSLQLKPRCESIMADGGGILEEQRPLQSGALAARGGREADGASRGHNALRRRPQETATPR